MVVAITASHTVEPMQVPLTPITRAVITETNEQTTNMVITDPDSFSSAL